MIVLLQKRATADPVTWTDLTIPELPSHDPVEFLMTRLRGLHDEGHFRIITDHGNITKFHIYRTEVFEVRVEG